MNRFIYFIFTLLAVCSSADAQVLTLDSCRARAIKANKQIAIAKVKQQVAVNTRKMARTKYLPHFDIAGGYMYSTREISLLSEDQKFSLSNIGTTVGMSVSSLQPIATKIATSLVQVGLLSTSDAQTLSNMMAELPAAFNEAGQKIVDAFETNTHQIITASATFTQPVFMGGAIIAGNKAADIAEKMAATNIEKNEQDITFKIDNAYWMVVSLHQKQKLADKYLALIQKLDADVNKMIKEGVATKADGLKVDVAVNEAEMTKTKVDNGLALAKMYLCQVCGMDLNSNVTLADELKENLDVDVLVEENANYTFDRRPELQLLNDAIDLTRQQTKIAKAGYLPQVAAYGGIFFSNPSVYNGFERKFKGAFNVGVMVRIPVFDWGDNMYKIRSARCATNLAMLTYDEAHEMIELQVSQSKFKVREANKQLVAAKKNIERAEENLRCANVGFKEGVMQTTDVMAAQTAWLQAQTQKIDAEIDVKLSETALKKAVGNL